MSLLLAVPVALILATFIAAFLYERTALGNHVDRWLAGPPAEDEVVDEMAELFDFVEWQSFPGDDLG